MLLLLTPVSLSFSGTILWEGGRGSYERGCAAQNPKL